MTSTSAARPSARWLLVAAIAISDCGAGPRSDRPHEPPSTLAPSAEQPAASSTAREAQPGIERGVAMIEIGPTDVMIDDTEYSLLAFAAYRRPVPASAYDACIAERRCPVRAVEQPSGAPDAAAVGMSWDAADAYCRSVGMRIQSAAQDVALSQELGDEYERAHLLPDVDPAAVVSRGFRCTRTLDR